MGVGRMPNVGLLLFRALHLNCAPHPGWTNEQPLGGGGCPVSLRLLAPRALVDPQVYEGWA